MSLLTVAQVYVQLQYNQNSASGSATRSQNATFLIFHNNDNFKA